MRFVARRFGGGFLALVASLLLLAVPAAADVPPGYDLFETDPEQTAFNFFDEFRIPESFFDLGSEPFSGAVAFGGDPLLRFSGRDVGDADMIIRRPQGFPLGPPFPSEATGPIELVDLALVGMEPIRVRVGDTTQLWDVRMSASPTEASQGQLRIFQSSQDGGLFDSQVQAYPKFTFTRVSDGETRVLDTATDLARTQELLRDLALIANHEAWRATCVPPALALPRFQEGFCPGLTINPHLRLVVHKAPALVIGVRPAQPRLEHFSCYDVSPSRKFRKRKVKLRDQFGRSAARVVKYGPLCAPARKRSEPWRNRRAHLQCYGIRRYAGKFLRRLVVVRNQFGSGRLRLLRPSGLCLPTVKTRANVRKARPLRGAARIDHFACYLVRPASGFKARTVVARDQFGRAKVRVLKPASLCAPVSKNGGRVLHPVRHLVCYRMKRGGKFKIRKKRVHNQFGRARLVKVVRQARFCVPSLKARVG